MNKDIFYSVERLHFFKHPGLQWWVHSTIICRYDVLINGFIDVSMLNHPFSRESTQMISIVNFCSWLVFLCVHFDVQPCFLQGILTLASASPSSKTLAGGNYWPAADIDQQQILTSRNYWQTFECWHVRKLSFFSCKVNKVATNLTMQLKWSPGAMLIF